ncbi:hypothetical protein L9F63_010202, partial [Diploptera punctata]
MPDVSRSNSQRSDSSRPRVSFNRDVHVKRISTPGAPRVIGALASDGEGHLVPLPVRRERPTHLSKRELAKEAERVLAQADSINCTSRSPLDQHQKTRKRRLNSNKKFSTLPPLRRKNKKYYNSNRSVEESPASSPERHTTPPSSLGRKTGRNFIASVFPTRNKEDEVESLKKSKKNSSSLNDLLDNSSREKSNKQKVELKRSVSDAGARKNIKIKKSSGFLSLDRLTSKRNKNKNKSLVIHSDCSDRSPLRPRKNILKKSYSDSESIPQDFQSDGKKKKQLSPIIEAQPREDYFHERNTSGDEDKMIHSSQLPAQRPTLTRGQTVDAMVKRLSQDFSRSRGPPRVVNSAPGLITPEHRQHNNNLPFSYTKPTTNLPTGDPTCDPPAGNTSLPTAVDGQVIYAQVVVSGGNGSGGAVSKQTVHTKVLPITHTQEDPIQPKFHARNIEDSCFPNVSSGRVTVRVAEANQHSDEDEGLDLTMEGGYRYNSDYNGKSYNRKGVVGGFNGGNTYVTKTGFVEKRIRNGGEERTSFHNSRREEKTDFSGNKTTREFTESKYESENYSTDPSVRGRADGMDSRRKDFLTENYTIGRYNDILYPSHIDDVSSKYHQNHFDNLTKKETYKTEFLSDARIIPPDEIDGQRQFARETKDFLPRNIDNNDLSSRRDRLESRIESQRKERFVSNKYSDSGNYKKDPMDIRNEINGKYTTDSAYNSRRDFLNSQLDYNKEDVRHENGVKTSRFYQSTTEADSYGKKDLFADSGIEIDYRSKDQTSRKYDKSSLNDNKVLLNHHTHNVTRVDLRNSDDEGDIEKDGRNISDASHYHKTKSVSTFSSKQLIQEQKNDAIPSSTVLIRHWVPSNKDETIKSKKTQTSKTKQESLLSDEEYEEYEKSRRKDEHKKENVEERIKKSEEKVKKNVDKKETKKKQTSAMDKMRQLFSRSENKSGKKNKRKEGKVKTIVEEDEEEEDPVTARYTEYRGSNVDLRDTEQETPRPVLKNKRLQEAESNMDTYHQKGHSSPKSSHRSRSHHTKDSGDNLDEGTPRPSHRSKHHKIPDIDEHRESEEFHRPNRERLATPSPSPSPPRSHNRSTSATLTRINNMKNKENGQQGGSWFKSLDRLTKRSKNRAK